MPDSPSHPGPLHNNNNNNNNNNINNNNGTSTSTSSTSSSNNNNNNNHAGYHAVRRLMTVDDGVPLRRRTPLSPLTSDTQFEPSRRRSSTFSEYSLNEARRCLQDDILNPGAFSAKTESSSWSSVPLAFALLPALGGVFFKDGSAVVTDIMLLGLAAVFLHWSVTQPWIWYYSAQEVRIKEEKLAELVFDDESDGDVPLPTTPKSTATLGEVPEEVSPPLDHTTKATKNELHQARKALSELFVHEIMALISCFGFPLLGAYMLHAIRGQLSRPSEGLVSNYNLTIFVLAAEIHPLSHLIKLVQARTLHLQRMVHTNPYKVDTPSAAQVQELSRRMDDLEVRAANAEAAGPNTNPVTQNGHGELARQQAKQEAAMLRNVRNAIQPELDALNRAVRRSEKKATVLAFQTEARFGAVDVRLGDAIALAAAAAKNSAPRQNVLSRAAETILWAVWLPVQAVVGIATLPFRTLLGRKKTPSHDKIPRDRRGVKAVAGSRGSGSDRVPSRLSRN